jgi:hypothetical protein
MKNNLYRGFLVLLISLYTSASFSVSARQNGQVAARSKTPATKLARASPEPRASPGDTTRCSIKMTGKSNTIILNGKVLVSTPDSTEKRNNIRVTGEGNRVTIHQTDQTSEVTVTQKGKNNQIKISQTNK